MIPLLLIILFIIFLLYVLRKRHVEEYLIEGVSLSWRNKMGVEDIVNKWILVVKDTQGNEIHRTENSDLNNRKNDTDVRLNVFTDKTFGDNIIGNNTIDIYYNDGSGDKLINTQILRFEKDEFNEDISSFEFRNLDMSAWENAQNKDCEGIYSKVKKDKSTPGVEKFGCGPSDDPNKHDCQFWEYKHTQKQLGTGKPCTRDEGHVIKVEWPKKANTDRVGLQFVDDPDPNTDSKVADTPQHYKSLFDQQQAVVDTQEKENAKIAKEAADKAAAEAFGGLIPNQTKLGDDGWCGHGGVVIHQVDGDVNTAKGCKRICSDINQVWTRDTSYGKWDSAEANRIVEECTDAKLDSIWEKDGDGKRKLRSGFTASKDYVPPSTSTRGIRYVWFGYENSSWSNRPLNIREIEVYSGGVNIVEGFGGDKVESITGFYRDGNEFPPQQLFDQKSSRYNFGHTKDSKTNYFKIDLGKEYSVIDKVMVYNRTDCCHDRWAESFVKLLNTNGNEIVRSTDTLPSDRSKATNYKEGGVRVKTFTFGNTVATPPPLSTTPTNQDCEGHWVNDPTGRSSSKAQKNYKTVKYVVTKPKSGNGKDCMWAFTRKNPHVGATDVTRNWAGYAFGNDQWTSEVVTDGQKGEVFNYQNTKGYRMNDPMHGEEFENMYEWKQNYLRFCMRKPNVALDYSKVISGRNKDIYTDAYGTIRYNGTCRDDDD